MWNDRTVLRGPVMNSDALLGKQPGLVGFHHNDLSKRHKKENVLQTRSFQAVTFRMNLTSKVGPNSEFQVGWETPCGKFTSKFHTIKA